MNPAIVITIIELVLKLAPNLVSEFRLLLSKGDPTPADWEELRAKVGKSYDDYINETRTPTGGSGGSEAKGK